MDPQFTAVIALPFLFFCYCIGSGTGTLIVYFVQRVMDRKKV
jgi:hypothetical protein